MTACWELTPGRCCGWPAMAVSDGRSRKQGPPTTCRETTSISAASCWSAHLHMAAMVEIEVGIPVPCASSPAACRRRVRRWSITCPEATMCIASVSLCLGSAKLHVFDGYACFCPFAGETLCGIFWCFPTLDELKNNLLAFCRRLNIGQHRSCMICPFFCKPCRHP